MPATQLDYSQIKANQDKAASLNQQASQYVSGSNVLGDKVMEAVRADRVQRGVSKLATDVGNVSGQMFTDPNAIREGPQSLSGQGLVDPFSVNALTSNARAQNLRTLGTIATQTAANQGSIDEVIQAGANQLKARAQTLLAEAEKANADAIILQGEWERMMKERELVASQSGSGETGLGLNPTPTTEPAASTVDEEYPVYPGAGTQLNWGESIKELTPEFIRDPAGYYTKKFKSAFIKVGLDWAFKKFRDNAKKQGETS